MERIEKVERRRGMKIDFIFACSFEAMRSSVAIPTAYGRAVESVVGGLSGRRGRKERMRVREEGKREGSGMR